MARYRYKARDKSGSLMTGILESPGRDAAAIQLSQLGYLPVRIQEATGWDWRESLKTLEESLTQVTPQDKIILTRQMATLIDAGLSFVAVFDALIDQTANPRLRGILTQVRRDVEGGMRFSDSLAKHPVVFDELYGVLLLCCLEPSCRTLRKEASVCSSHLRRHWLHLLEREVSKDIIWNSSAQEVCLSFHL